MSELRVAPIPVCPTHGLMHWDFHRERWACRGFDGEGCDYAPDDAKWTGLGTVDDADFPW